MASLSPAEIVKPGRPAIFADKIWKMNGRKPVFQMTDGKSFTAQGCVVGDWEYDVGDASASAATKKKHANEVKKALRPGVKPVELIGKVNGRGAVTVLPLTKFEKTTEFGGQGGVSSTGAIPKGAAATRAQELGSTYIFKLVLGTSKKSWTDVNDLKKDKTTMKELNKIWQKEIKMNVNQTWLEGYFKQYKKILDEFGGGKWTEFDHSGSTSFMTYISALVNTKFGISQKDNWDPADMWLIKGTTEQVKKKLDMVTEGSKFTQTITELNAEMRRMYKARELVGVSLKAISGNEAAFTEYNVSKFTSAMADNYRFPNIKLTIDLSEDMSQDSKAELRHKNGTGGFNFQIKSNSSTSWAGLKWESTPQGATAARGGKAQVAKVIEMLKDDGRDFDKDWSNYPEDRKEYQKEHLKWETKFRYVNGKATTKCKSAGDFSANIEKMFRSGVANSKVANSKLMQLAFLYDILKIKENKGVETYTSWWTDLVFLSIKLGNQYGPFGKLY